MIAFDVREAGRHMPRERYSRGHISKSKAKPQKWQGDWFIYRDVEGKEKPIHRGPKLLRDEHGNDLPCSKVNKSEAQKHLDRMIEADRTPQDQKHGRAETLKSYWLRYCILKEPGWSKAMTANIKWIFEKHVFPGVVNPALRPKNQIAESLGDTPLTALTREMLQAHLNELAKTKSKSLVGKVRTYFKAVLDEALEADLIEKNPARKLDVPTTKATCKKYQTDEECQKLLDRAIAEGKPREHLIIRMCMSLGPRRGEVFSLRRNDYQPGRLRIDESVDADCVLGPTKTEGSATWIPLPVSLEVELCSWIARLPKEQEFLFEGFILNSMPNGQPMRPANYLRRVLKPLATRAGVGAITVLNKKGKQVASSSVNFQSLRRTTATHGAKHGTQKDLQGTMRHSTPQMTMGVYAQSIPEGVRNLVQKLDDELTGGKIQ